MYNHRQYNNRQYEGSNFGFDFDTPPVYSPSVITAVANVEQGVAVPKFIIGGAGGADQNTRALMKKSTSYVFSMWQSKAYLIGVPFNIVSIELPLHHEVETDDLLIPVLNFDDGDTVVAGNAIRLFEYQDAPQHIILGAGNFNYNVHGNRSFHLELHFRGTLNAVMLPIKIEVETEEQG